VTTPSSLLAAVGRIAAAALGATSVNRRGNSYAVTLITPILPDASDELRDVLRGFKLGSGSPLAKVPDVHFARWVVIDRLRLDWPGAPKRPSRLRSQYLLFSADLTAPAYRAACLPGTFFRDLAHHIPDECDAVWKHCMNFPGVDEVDHFVKYLSHSQIDIDLYYAAFPDLTPSDISRAINVRQGFAQFVLQHQDALVGDRGHDTLKAAYIKESASWAV